MNSIKNVFIRMSILTLTIMFWLNFSTVYAQNTVDNLTLNGPAAVAVGDTATYYLRDPTLGYDYYTGSKYFGFEWGISSGLMLSSNDLNRLDVQWTNGGSQSVFVACNDYFYNFYYKEMNVTVLVDSLSMNGPSTVDVGETASYYLEDLSLGSNTFSSKYTEIEWGVRGGALISPNFTNQMDVQWIDGGSQSIFAYAQDIISNVYYRQIDVEVNDQFQVPEAPTVLSSNCNSVVLQRSNPPSGVIWYWQSSVDGTSTANADPTITLTSGTEYFLRAKYISENQWSASSSSVHYEIGVKTPTIDIVIQPTATTTTGSVVLSNLPNNGTWTINPGGISGTGTSSTITGLAPGIYHFTVTNSSACVSDVSASVIINTFCNPLTNGNYIHTIVPTKETTNVASLLQSQKIETITYFDGLGRPIQNIGIRAGGSNQDVITHIGYDVIGRQVKDFLPYAEISSCGLYRGDALSASESFYSTSNYENTLNPYSEKELEASPLNRVLKQAAPGNDWMMKSVGIECASCIDGNTADFYTEICTQYRDFLTTETSINLDLYDPGYYEYNTSVGIAYRNNNPLPPMNGINSGPDKTIKFEYHFNSAIEVRLYGVDLNIVSNTYLPVLTGGWGYYTAGQLNKVITKDENWLATQSNLNKDHTTEEFKDKEGRVVLKRTYDNNVAHDTYYIYDDYGNLTFVLPPKVNTTDGVSAEELEELCYQYTYDQKNRLVEKKLPGKGAEYIVYDKLDRPVLTQDANLRIQNKWLFTKYDVLGRPVYTGDYKNSVTTTRADMQGLVDAETYLFESRTAANTINTTTVYYTNVAFPAINDTNINVFTINYYDDYGFDIDGGVSEPVGTNPQITPSTATKGLATGSKIRVLGENSWITNVIYYDAKARPIYNYSKNNYLGTIAKVKTELDFVGKPTKTTTTHVRNNLITTVVDSLTYDPQGRLLTQRQKINTQPEELIVSNEYDELGQLKGKGVGGKATATSPLQTVDYTYNIRGWLKGINDGDNDNSTITLGSGDLFGFQINYNNPTDASKALYNGNISQTFWKTANTDTSLKNYTYTYDALNRLINAKYSLEDRYNETLSYDKNGNIMSLIRTGNTDVNISTAFGVIDNLTYSYGPSNLHNRLTRVSDTQSNIAGLADEFKDNGLNSDDYGYDINGNMTRDDNKGITAISYNHLNLPTSVTMSGGTINYTYDATGVKQRKIVSTGITTDYAGGFQYEKSGDNNPAVLQFFPTAEGYAEYNATNGIFSYIYQYKDHLGNVRLSYKDVGTTTPSLQIVEESNYYPFGLKQKVAGEQVVNSGYKYKYNGKELQDENIGGVQLNLYDYGARNYDPALGRWMNLDPLAEQMRRHSPYNYAFNNPIYFIDPDGMAPDNTWTNGQAGFAEAWRDLQNQAKTWKGKDNIGEDGVDGEFERDKNGKWQKVSTVGDDIGVDFYHTNNKDSKGNQLTYATDGKGNWAIINNGRKTLSGEIRGNDVNWKTIYNEWKNDTGPVRSIFQGTHPANIAIHANYLYRGLYDIFLKSGKPKRGYEANFYYGWDNYWTFNNMQVQMMGSYNASFYKLGDTVLNIIQDSKSRSSFYYHAPVQNYERGQGYIGKNGMWYPPIKGENNTYQTYIFMTTNK